MSNHNPTNIVHKPVLRIADLAQVAGGFKESNRQRMFNTVVANATAVNVLIAPWNGRVESILVNSPSGATTSSGGNSVTIAVKDATTNATVVSFDTLVNTTELKSGTGVYFEFPNLTLSNGGPAYEFRQNDVLTLTITVTGAPGISNANSLNIVTTYVPADKDYAY